MLAQELQSLFEIALYSHYQRWTGQLKSRTATAPPRLAKVFSQITGLNKLSLKLHYSYFIL
jgi:hypothetical protein